MFKHVLIPIDGSEFSDKAIDVGVRFAKSVGARITGFVAEPEYQIPEYGALIRGTGESMDAHGHKVRSHAEAALARIAVRARAEGVAFDSDFAESVRPAEAIVEAAEKHQCDLILMASHGRHGLDKLLHGSAAQDVITHTRIPVLVLR